MFQSNNRKYQMIKDEKIIMETRSATMDKAIDYFLDLYPEAYTDPTYKFKIYKGKNS